MPRVIKIVIPRNGAPRAIYDPFTAATFGELGQMQIDRASYVDTWLSLNGRAQGELCYRHVVAVDMFGQPSLVKPITGEYAHLYTNFLALWWADMVPVGGGVYGPFVDRSTALTYEHDWLYAHHIPLTNRLRQEETSARQNQGVQENPEAQPAEGSREAPAAHG